MVVKLKEVRKFQRAVNVRRSTLARKQRKASNRMVNTMQAHHTVYGSALSACAKGITMPSSNVVQKCKELSESSYRK